MTLVQKRLPFILLGRLLGSYDSVDILPETGMRIYDFEPSKECKLPKGTLMIDLGKGTVTLSSGTGSHDLVDAIADLPKTSDKDFDDAVAALDAPQDLEEEEKQPVAGPSVSNPEGKPVPKQTSSDIDLEAKEPAPVPTPTSGAQPRINVGTQADPSSKASETTSLRDSKNEPDKKG